MSFILRKLRNRAYWNTNLRWLGESDIQANAAKCLETQENMLSVFAFDDIDTQIDRIVAALALTRSALTRLDIALLPVKELEPRNILQRISKGNTPDDEVNEWHLDLMELTLSKITELASAIRDSGQVRRYETDQISDVIQRSLNLKKIDNKRINQKLISHLSEHNIVI